MISDENVGKLLGAHAESMKKIDRFQSTLDSITNKQTRDDTLVKIGSWLVGIIASLSLTLAGWALARASAITTLEAQRASDVAVDDRQDATLDGLTRDMAIVQQDVAATRADIRNMSTLLRSQDTNLRALLAEEAEDDRRRR